MFPKIAEPEAQSLTYQICDALAVRVIMVSYFHRL